MKVRHITDLKTVVDVPVCKKNELIIFHCDDKKDNEKWTQSRSYINKPRPYRLVLVGPPGSGKSSICKNLIVQATPEYSKVFVIANGSSYEWSDYCDVLLTVDELSKETLNIFTEDVVGQRILIIDDVELQHVNKTKKEFFNMMFKHVSSHYNLTVIVSIQEYKMLPIELRANINVFCISLNIKDTEGISVLGKKIGLSYNQFKNLFINLKNSIENKQYSYLVIDNTNKSPIQLSINFFNKIDLDNI